MSPQTSSMGVLYKVSLKLAKKNGFSIMSMFFAILLLSPIEQGQFPSFEDKNNFLHPRMLN